MTGRGDDTFSYDARGDLVRAVVGGTTVDYRYDGFGRLVAREQGAAKTRYVYGDPGDPTRVSAVVDPAGAVTLLRYDEEGRVVALERGGERFLVATDLVGTPKVVAKADGTVVKTLRHDAYGKVLTDSAPSFDLPIGFAGGLVDARHRLRPLWPAHLRPRVGAVPDLGPVALGRLAAQPLRLRRRRPGGAARSDRPRRDVRRRLDLLGRRLGHQRLRRRRRDGAGQDRGLALHRGRRRRPGRRRGRRAEERRLLRLKAFAEGGVELGMGFGLGGELSLDCFEAQGKASVTAGAITGEINSAGEVAVKTGIGGGAKGGIKACARW